MIYGANGYTGELVASLACRRGHRPVLAGRNRDKVEAVARRLDLSHRIVSLTDAAGLRASLDGIAAVLLTAGPFSKTSDSMVDACLETGTHYLDVTGEIEVLESLWRRDEAAQRRGVTLIGGVGFDVVPTDCLAALLAPELPGAVELSIACSIHGRVSRGTLKATLEGLGLGGKVRRDGCIVGVRLFHERRRVRFFDAERDVVAVPWGDVATAYHSTGIPNVTVYMALPAFAVAAARVLPRVLSFPPLERAVRTVIDRSVYGPSEARRRRGRAEVWAEVVDARGNALRGTLTTQEAYAFTAESALRAVERVLRGTDPGALTPSRAFGADFLHSLEGVVFHGLESARR
jgi:saccharopine dehydrogenase (NAD+, L-lysine-forming)